jgi:hypothetical protein
MATVLDEIEKRVNPRWLKECRAGRQLKAEKV